MALPTKDIASSTSEVLIDEMRHIANTRRGLGGDDRSAAGSVRAPAKGDRFEGEIEFEPIPGENEISVVAFNSQNSIRSLWQTARFTSTLPPEAAHLYVLAIGIDQYKDASENLKFAAKDARAFGERVRTQAASLYPKTRIRVETLVDEEATRSGILRKLEALAKHIRPSDQLILFVASHGILSGNQYSIITHDYDGHVDADSRISSNEIVDLSKEIRALNQLLVFDTCHAGGVDHVVSAIYDARLSVLAKRIGLHIYASASSSELALDGYRGNGLFTHSLLNGLDNNPEADGNGNHEVSVVELGDYTRERTTALPRSLGFQQTPLIIKFGHDRPMYRLERVSHGGENVDTSAEAMRQVPIDLAQRNTSASGSSCQVGYLDGRSIHEKLVGKTVIGKTTSSGKRWREYQVTDGSAFFRKSGGNKVQGHWKIQDDRICWCYGSCAQWSCKQIEMDQSCTAWYVDPGTGKRASEVLTISEGGM